MSDRSGHSASDGRGGSNAPHDERAAEQARYSEIFSPEGDGLAPINSEMEAGVGRLEAIGAQANPAIVQAVQEILVNIGENPERQGLRRTPERVARMYDELTAGYRVDPEALINDAIFDVDYDEMVVVRDIEFYSLCEHHLLPFFGEAHIAYIPDGTVIGLSKIPRVVDMFARRLQVQERMTQDIANFLQEHLKPCGVAVVVEASHMCAMMRGVRKANARMVTSAMHGEFKRQHKTRDEFLHLIGHNGHRQAGF